MKGIEPCLAIVRPYLLVHIEFSEYLSCIQQVLIVENPAEQGELMPLGVELAGTYFLPLNINSGKFSTNAIQ